MIDLVVLLASVIIIAIIAVVVWVLRRNVRRGEWPVVAAAALYFFCLLACNYILRPLREEMGIRGGADDLPWLYTGTLVATLLIAPPFAWLVSRTDRRRFISVTYRLFALSLVGFYFWLRGAGVRESVASYTYFIWFSAVNLLIVSLFWGFMADVLANEQAKRIYGLVGAGGTLGAIAGSQLTSWLMNQPEHPDPVTLLLIAAAMMEVCVQCMRWIAARAPLRPAPSAPFDASPRQVDALTGLRLVIQKPYLRILCIYMVLQTICATFFYNQRGYIVDAEISDRAARVRFFADIDFWVNTISLTFQLLFTGNLLKTVGVRPMLLALPLFGVAGFTWLASAGSLLAIKFSMIATRACEFATAKPARETLYTVVSREEKYQAKGFIDTFVYRGGDMIGAWFFHGLRLMLAQGGTAWVGVPLATGFTAAALVLGRRQEALARAANAQEEASATADGQETAQRLETPGGRA